MYSVEANTQMSKGVTEKRVIKTSGVVFFLFRKENSESSLKVLYIVMISRFPEFLLDLKPVFSVCTQNSRVTKCRPKH